MQRAISRLFIGLLTAYFVAFFGVLIAGCIRPEYRHSLAAKLVARTFFAVFGSISVGIAIAAIRSGSITVGKHRKRTFTRADRPVDFWGFTFWWLIFGLGFFILGIGGLVSLALHGPS